MPGFTPKDWRNATAHDGGGDTSTPISAVALEDLETRVTNYTTMLAGAAAGVYSVDDYGAIGDGTTNDTSAIQAAITAADAAGGGIVHLSNKVYAFAGTITFPVTTPVSLCGVGGAGWSDNTDGSVLKGTNAASQILFLSPKTLNTGFQINGNSIANYPMWVGHTFAPTFIGITACNSVQDACTIYDTQQPAVYDCDFGNSGRDALVLNGSAQSGMFSRIDCGGSLGRHGIRIGPDAGVNGFGAYFHKFDMVLIEQQGTPTSYQMLKLEDYAGGAGIIIFDHLQIANGATGVTHAILCSQSAADRGGKVEFRNLDITTGVSQGVRVTWTLGEVHLRGRSYFATTNTTVPGFLTSNVAGAIHVWDRLVTGGTGPPPVMEGSCSPIVNHNAQFFPGNSFASPHNNQMQPYSLFTDSGNSNKLCYKDGAGVTNVLY